MRHIDIIGGGLAGLTAAAIRGRAGIPTVLIDAEKISGDEQLGRFHQTGLADSGPAADAQRNQRRIKWPRLLLVVILIIVIVFIVVVGLSGSVVRRAALVVPELAVDAVGRKELRMRAALDRPAA
jgi:flavin-dependent dehydrogenase